MQHTFRAALLTMGMALLAPLAAPAEPLIPPTVVSPGATRTWNLRQTPVVEVVKRTRDAVVNIHSERTVRGPASEDLFSLTPSQNRINGMGTGILIDPRGYIITNQHVVEDVNLIRVRLRDGTTATARVVARDTETDLALLKIDVDHALATMPLGTARDLAEGETVVAIGNAYGYEHTVTVGIVSAIGRDVNLNKEVSYRSLIQTDAAINPGNSGGPLLNIYGELIGVNVAIRAGAQGIGFAIPVDTMIVVAGRLLAGAEGGGSPLADLGLSIKDEINLSRSDTTSGESSRLRRVVVTSVQPGGPAARAGLTAGDTLIRAGELPVHSSLDLCRALLDRQPGAQVPLVVSRSGSEQRVVATLGNRSTIVPASEPGDRIWSQLGMLLQPAVVTEVTRVNPQLHGGLMVSEIRTGSPAARAGIRAGDILVGLHQWEMLSRENVLFVLNHPDLAAFQPLRFYLLRAGQVHRGTLQATP